MSRSPIAAITIVSLLLLAVCCQVLPSMHLHIHDAMESVPELAIHLLLLTMSIPASVLALMSIFAVFLSLITMSPIQLRNTTATPYRHDRPPDLFVTPPLLLALADGIINPKPY